MPTAQRLKVLVYGATGAQGAPVVRQLLEQGHHPYVLTRTPAKAVAFQAAGATVIGGDMADVERLRAVSEGMDGVALLIPFFANPGDALQYGRNAIDVARAAGVPLLVWNSSGHLLPTKVGNPSLDLRLDIMEHLQASGIKHIVLQPSVYLENLLGPYTAPFVMERDRLTYPYPPELRCGWIAADDVAALVVAALERPELANTSMVLSGVANPNGPELAAEFAAALGRPISYEALQPSMFGTILDESFGLGAGRAAASAYQELWDHPERWPVLHVDMQPVLARLPVRMRSIREWVGERRAAFTLPRAA